MTTIVLTSIHAAQTTSVADFAKYGHVIVVGDCKTPHETYNKNNVEYIHPDEQTKRFALLSAALPYNHYCRKNIGYMASIAAGCETLFDTDDDNWPMDGAFDREAIAALVGRSEWAPFAGCFANPFRLFADTKLWPRGFPLQALNDNQETLASITPPTDWSVGIVQSLVQGDPDVDAICRLTRADDLRALRFEPNRAVRFPPGTYVPANTQATWWLDRKIFYLLYVPCTVSFRFCDILKMYIAQRCIWEHRQVLCYTSPHVEQRRNEHNLMQDFASEVPMYTQVLAVVDDVLEKVTLDGTPDDLIVIYTRLIELAIVQPDEMQPLNEWVRLCKQYLIAG